MGYRLQNKIIKAISLSDRLRSLPTQPSNVGDKVTEYEMRMLKLQTELNEMVANAIVEFGNKLQRITNATEAVERRSRP